MLTPGEYKHDPARLKDFLRAHKLTGAEVGKLLGADGRTTRRWTAERGVPGASDMPYSAWYTLHHIVTGEVPQATPSTSPERSAAGLRADQ